MSVEIINQTRLYPHNGTLVKIIKVLGLIPLTDIFMYKPVPEYFYEDIQDEVDMNDGNVNNKQPAVIDGPQSLAPVTHVRKYFPETWLWLNGQTSLNGEVTFASKVPDTITSWEATAFSISPTNGLGLTTKPAKLNAFQPFFISLNLPYSIRRGEDFELIVAVNNYLQQDVDVRVTLERSDDFGVLSVNSIEQEFIHEDMIENVQVRRQSAISVSFQIQPKKLGDILISVKAQSMNAPEADQMKKSVNVKPEGFKMVNNTVLSVDMTDITMFDDNVNIWYPLSVVMGSKRAEVKVTGDVMGPVLENLEKLLEVPTGCGEQNMLKMVPNIVVVDYLMNVNKITPEIKERAFRNMKTGYQRELNYRHSDGSFSAFGKQDAAGSTWLSAFVLKSFSQAGRFITIDRGIQTKTFTWLNTQLKPNGEFNEPGRVIHQNMLGGAGTGNKGLTAFVLTAMLESKDFIERSLYNSATSKTIKYLEDLVDRNEIKTKYETSIIAYALTLAKSQRAEVLIKQLNDGEKPWTTPPVMTTPKIVNDKAEMRVIQYHPPKATASDVETWAYALLSYVKNKDVSNSRPIVRWLMSQQNPKGGFFSTQDTVIGLQALADYGELTFSTAKDLTITVTAGTLKNVFTVNKENALIYQSFMLSPDSTDVQVSATGVGMAIVKVIWRYYSKTDVPSLLPQDGDNKAPIVLTVASKKATNQKSNVVACVKCMKDIGMSLITVDMPSGHSPNNMQELDMNKLIKRAEYKEDSLYLYLDKIPQEESCFNVEIMQTQKVGNLQDVPVKAMAYYQTEIQSSVMYNVEVNSKNFCDMCKGNNCHGCPSSVASRWTTASITAVAAICVLLSLIFSI